MEFNKLTTAIALGMLVSSNTLVAQDNLVGNEVDRKQALEPQQVKRDDGPHNAKRHKQMHEKIREKAYAKRKNRTQKSLLELDQNNDDQVDLTEYLSHAETRFNRLDSDGDGYVTKQEALKRHKELRKKHREHRREIREVQDEAAPNF